LVETQIGEQQHATVRWINRGRERFPDKYIFEDLTQFYLCSKDGVTEAVMVKGMNVKVSVEWIMTDGFKWKWRRSGDFVCDMGSVNSLDLNSRRGSYSSVVSSVGSSVFGWNNEPAMGDTDFIGLEHILPELLAKNDDLIRKVTLKDIEKYSSLVPCDTSPKSIESGFNRAKFTFSDPFTITIPSETVALHNGLNARCPSCNVFQNENDYIKDIMKMCSENPSVMNWIMKWSNKEMGSKQAKEDYQMLSHGRVWVTARLHPKTEDAAWQAAVNELKGAYQQTESGSEVYLQSTSPKSNQKRCRLRRSHTNLWIIELQNGPNRSWSTCVEQVSGEQWIDHRYDRRTVVVKVIPLQSILERLGGQRKPETQRFEKCLQFLFTTCDQKKLFKLKLRNIKHNIANVKTKLDKQHSLAFSIQLSKTAENLSAEM